MPPTDKIHIDSALVQRLIVGQFSKWANLSIKPVALSGWDNRTFRLGDNMLVRLPSGEGYAEQVQKEQTWLPKLAPHLSVSIPTPLAMGKPGNSYPYNWSVYKWIEGESANTLTFNESQLQHIAVQLVKFLNELHKINTPGAPPPGLHNYHRGNSPAAYDADTRKYIKELSGIIDAKAATALWEKAISIKWNKNPVWVHGDFASGNILVREGKLAAVIDFGCMAVGDPACDLVIAWTFLKRESRKAFKEYVNVDADTWVRARGWALWKACFELCNINDKTNQEALRHQQIINAVINEHEHENGN